MNPGEPPSGHALHSSPPRSLAVQAADEAPPWAFLLLLLLLTPLRLRVIRRLRLLRLLRLLYLLYPLCLLWDLYVEACRRRA